MRVIQYLAGSSLFISLITVSLSGNIPAIPGTEIVKEPVSHLTVEGRLEGDRAMLVRDGSVSWEYPDAGPTGQYYIEFWIKTVGWNALDGEARSLAEFVIGTDRYTLEKEADRTNLILAKDGQPIQLYPIYGWDYSQWDERQLRRRPFQRSLGWHHIVVSISGEQLQLTIDGFPARIIKPAQVHGSLVSLTLKSASGTAYMGPFVTAGGSMDRKVLRQRYLTLLLGQPTVGNNAVVVSRMGQAPQIDGVLEENEWADAVRISGWVSASEGRFVGDNVAGYLGYDKERIYIALVRYFDGEGTYAGKDESFDIYFGPPFVSGERPRRLVRMSGDIKGGQDSAQVLPIPNPDWDGAWEWKTNVDETGWTAEFSARFEDLGMSEPDSRETWTLNIINEKADLAWAYPAGRNENVERMGVLRFIPGAVRISAGDWYHDDGFVGIPVEIAAGNRPRQIQTSVHFYAEGDIEPSETLESTETLDRGEKTDIILEMPVGEHATGRIAISIRVDGEQFYYHSGGFPFQNEK